MRRFHLLATWPGLVFLAAVLHGPPAPALAQTNAVDGYIRRARELDLASQPEWRNLLHMRRSIVGLDRSLVDDPRFFLARDGKTNPDAELAADVRAFFEPLGTNAAEHAICRFVARFHWLNERLTFDTNLLPCTDCALFEKVAGHVDANAVALVYPAAFMNGPASMFGHTLLVFDAESKNRLLSRAVSYAAKSQSVIGPLFAFAGIFGFYPGYYAFEPYYDKVEQYGDIGHRDVWEYELNFTPEEVARMLRHAWELQNIYSRYFFFDENCAFNLLFLLDVARPSLELTRRVPWFVIPINTVREVERRGIVREVAYRPSSVTRISHLADSLPTPDSRLALDLAHGRAAASNVAERVNDPERQRQVLDLAAAYTQYLYTEKTLPKDVYSMRLMDALRARSQLGRSDPNAVSIPTPPRPDFGHAPAKIAAGAGVQDDDAFASLEYRIAYHALTDNDDGFTQGAQIQFLHTEGRYYAERDALELQRFDLVDVCSLAPRSAMFKPSSWKVRAGVGQADFRKGDDTPLYQVNTGAGLAFEAGKRGLWYVMADGDAQIGDDYDAGYALGMGPSAGVVASPLPGWKHTVQAKACYFGIGDEVWRLTANWSQDLRIAPNVTVAVDLSVNRNDTYEFFDGQVRLNRYF